MINFGLTYMLKAHMLVVVNFVSNYLLTFNMLQPNLNSNV